MPPFRLRILDCGLRIANAPTIAESTERSASRSATVWPAISRHIASCEKQKPDGDLSNRHPALMRFLERAKLRSCAEKAACFPFINVPRQVPPNMQLTRRSWVDSSTCNLSLVIYVFRACENGRKVAFEIVEVCRVGTVIPNNGTTINQVRVA